MRRGPIRVLKCREGLKRRTIDGSRCPQGRMRRNSLKSLQRNFRLDIQKSFLTRRVHFLEERPKVVVKSILLEELFSYWLDLTFFMG